jgi:hypothetical protein
MTDQYIHYHFFEQCEDTPTAILALIEKMFAEIASLPEGRHVWLRVRPSIERENTFEDARIAVVHFRFSLQIEPEQPMPP